MCYVRQNCVFVVVLFSKLLRFPYICYNGGWSNGVHSLLPGIFQDDRMKNQDTYRGACEF